MSLKPVLVRGRVSVHTTATVSKLISVLYAQMAPVGTIPQLSMKKFAFPYKFPLLCWARNRSGMFDVPTLLEDTRRFKEWCQSTTKNRIKKEIAKLTCTYYYPICAALL